MDVLFVLLELFPIVQTALLFQSNLIIIGHVPAFLLEQTHQVAILSHVHYLLQLDLHPSSEKWVFVIGLQEILLGESGDFDLGALVVWAADLEVLAES